MISFGDESKGRIRNWGTGVFAMNNGLAVSGKKPSYLADAQASSIFGVQKTSAEISAVLVQDAFVGALLQGPKGVGKHEIIDAFVEASLDAWDVYRIKGTSYGGSIDYGALQFLLTDLSDNDLASSVAVYGELKRRAMTAAKPQVMILDRVALLDEKTVAVIMQLALEGIFSVIVVTSPNELLPEEFAILRSSRKLALIEVGNLDFAEARTILEFAGGAPASVYAVAKLLHLTDGNREWFKALAEECINQEIIQIQSNVLVYSPGSIRLEGNILAVAHKYLDELTPVEKAVMEIIALSREVEANHFSNIASLSVDKLFSSGLIRLNPTTRKLCLSSKFLGETLARNISADQFTHLCIEAVEKNIVAADSFPDETAFQTWLRQRRHATESSALRIFLELGCANYPMPDSSNSEVHDGESATAKASTTVGLSSSAMVHGQLVECRRLLQTRALKEAEMLAGSLSCVGSAQNLQHLSSCQRHEAAALAAEASARLGNYQDAEKQLEWLRRNSRHSATEAGRIAFAHCRNATFRSSVIASFLLGDWRTGHEIVTRNVSLESLTPENYAFSRIFLGLFRILGGAGEEAHEELAISIPQLSVAGETELLSLISPLLAARGSTSTTKELQDKEPEVDKRSRLPELSWYGTYFSTLNECFENPQLDELQRMLELASTSEMLGQPIMAAFAYTAVNILRLAEGLPVTSQDEYLGNSDLVANFQELARATSMSDSPLIANALVEIVGEGFSHFANSVGQEYVRRMTPVQKRSLLRTSREVLIRLHCAPQDMLDSPVSPTFNDSLTKREQMIAAAAVLGLSNAEIAAQSGVSIRTVEGHLYQVYSKLDLSNRNDLVKFWFLTHAQEDITHD